IVRHGDALVSDLLARLFQSAVTVVETMRGVVADFNGDGALVVFDGPDRVDRAIYAGLALSRIGAQECAAALGTLPVRDSVAHVGLGVGIDEGGVRVRVVGTVNNSALIWTGLSTHTAAKLAAWSRPRTVSITSNAYALIRNLRLRSGLRTSRAGG